MTAGFTPPPYPYDRLGPLAALAGEHEGGMVDLSVGTPLDPPPPAIAAALGAGGSARGYPPSIGTEEYRSAAAAWLERRFGISVGIDQVAACVGTKELVASTPGFLRLRRPDRDVVLYPAVSYPTYAMGATLAGCRAVPVPVDPEGRLRLDAIADSDAGQAVCLWVNSPANPTGSLDDLGAAARWGRAHDVPVVSDECYAEFTWDGPPRTILEAGTDGVLAVHSLSKRSNLAGARVGFYAGDGDLVEYLRQVRKHAGLMVPGPVQSAGTLAWADDGHVGEQRARYQERIEAGSELLAVMGLEAHRPAGAFYLWPTAPDGDAWALADRFARDGGALVSPGEFYGPAGADHVRLALVQDVDRLAVVTARIAVA